LCLWNLFHYVIDFLYKNLSCYFFCTQMTDSLNLGCLRRNICLSIFILELIIIIFFILAIAAFKVVFYYWRVERVSIKVCDLKNVCRLLIIRQQDLSFLLLIRIKHWDKSWFSQQSRYSFLFATARNSSVAAGHHYKMSLWNILIIFIVIRNE
jgi:hypothetical protein